MNIFDSMSYDSCSCTQEDILYQTLFFQATEPQVRGFRRQAGKVSRGRELLWSPYH